MNVLKRFLITAVIVAAVGWSALPGEAAMTNTIDRTPDRTWWRGGYQDVAWAWAKEVEDILEGTDGIAMLYFTPTSADPTGSTEGRVYYDSDVDKLYVRTSAGLLDLTAGASGITDLDTAYDGGVTVTVDAGAVALTATDAANNVVLAIDQQDTGSTVAQTITSAGTGALLSFDSNGTGADILGSDGTWTISKAGAGTFTGLTTGTLAITGVSTLGDGSSTVAVATSSWDISSSGAISGVTSLSLSDDITMADGKGVKGSTTTAQTVGLYGYDVDGAAYVGGLVITNSNTPATVLGNANGTTAVTSSDWAISTAGVMTGIGAVTADGLLTASAGQTLSGDLAINLDADGEDIVVTGTATNITAGSLFQIIMAAQDSNRYILNLQQTPDADANNKFILLEDNAGDDKFDISAGGTTTWTLDAASYVKIDADATANTGTDGVLDMNVKSATANHAAINLDYELDDGGSGTQYGIYIDLDDDAAGGDETFKAIYLANSAGTNATMNGLDIANTVDVGINAVLGATGKILVVDAEATINTGTAGLIDIGAILSEANAFIINMQVESEADGAGEVVGGIFIEMDDDADNADNEVRGIHIAGDGTNGIGLQHAIVVTGANIDAGLYLQTGYLRVGTGATPDVALGAADNAFIEGTLEVDGAARFDGTITANSTVTGDGSDALGGFLKTVTDDADAHTVTVAESGTVLTNAGAGGAFAHTLPAAAAGLEYFFVVMAAQELRPTPAAGDVINIAGTAGEAAEYWTANAVGETLHLVAVDGTNWVAVSYTGTWTQETP